MLRKYVRFGDRAERTGYRLARDQHPPYGWKLSATENDDRVYGGSMDQIDTWLTS